MPKKLVWGKKATEFDPNPIGTSSGVTATGEGYSGTVIRATCKACGTKLETDISIDDLEEAGLGNVDLVWMGADNSN